MKLTTLRNRWQSLFSSGLSRKAAKGSVWTLVEYFVQQGLRFGSNLVLTRLLFPEAFGIMVIINSVLMGLEMLSDVGVRLWLIQSKSAENPKFMGTAFTIKVTRGIGLWLIVALSSPLTASYFEKPEIAYLLPIAALAVVFKGFSSIKSIMAVRNISLGRLVALNLIAQAISIAIMVVWAIANPSIWALISGSVVAAALKCVFSHVFFPGERDRFNWDKQAANEIFKFGIWVFISTLLAFMQGRGDILFLGKVMTATELGILGIALNLASLVSEMVNKLGSTVLLPTYAKINREDPKRFDVVLWKTRSILIGFGIVVFTPFVLFGDYVVEFLYDDRYINAGWMLQTLACGWLVSLPLRTYDGVLHSKGLSKFSTFIQFFQVSCRFVGIIGGYYVFGLPGLIVGMGFTGWFAYPALAAIMNRAGVLQLKFDLLWLLVMASVAALFFVYPPTDLILSPQFHW